MISSLFVIQHLSEGYTHFARKISQQEIKNEYISLLCTKFPFVIMTIFPLQIREHEIYPLSLFISLYHDLQSLFNLVISLISNSSICYMIENTPQGIRPCTQEKVSKCYLLNMLSFLLHVRLCLVARIYYEDAVLLNTPWPHLTASFTLAASFN